jgi:hypothetical protein
MGKSSATGASIRGKDDPWRRSKGAKESQNMQTITTIGLDIAKSSMPGLFNALY